MRLRRLIREIMLLESAQVSIDTKGLTDQVADAVPLEEYVDEFVNKFTSELGEIAAQVQSAVDRIPKWFGSAVRVKMQVPREWNEQPYAIPHVYVGSAFFTILSDRDVEDVLEDKEDFRSPEEMADYLHLVSEMRSPGSTSRSNRIITLYTARPVRDRVIYTDASTVPPGIFLTSDLEDAMGIAADAGGRDVWEVGIRESEVVQTLDRGKIGWYQVVGTSPVPIDYIELIHHT